MLEQKLVKQKFFKILTINKIKNYINYIQEIINKFNQNCIY